MNILFVGGIADGHSKTVEALPLVYCVSKPVDMPATVLDLSPQKEMVDYSEHVETYQRTDLFFNDGDKNESFYIYRMTGMSTLDMMKHLCRGYLSEQKAKEMYKMAQDNEAMKIALNQGW